MLNNNGEIYFAEFDEIIHPDLLVSEFKKMKLFKKSKDYTINPPYDRYLLPVIKDGEKEILFLLNFNQFGNLWLIELWDGNENFRTSWNDYSEEKEALGNQSLKEWIHQCGLEIGLHTWGEISLSKDDKNGNTSWIISFPEAQNSF